MNPNLKNVIQLLEDGQKDPLISLEKGYFSLKNGEKMYDIALKEVDAVLRLKDSQIHDFPSENPHVRGLIYFNGQWIALVHFNWCNQVQCEKLLCQHIIIAKSNEEKFGILVEQIIDMHEDLINPLLDLDIFKERV